MIYYEFSEDFWGYPLKFTAEWESEDSWNHVYIIYCVSLLDKYGCEAKIELKRFKRAKPFGRFNPDEMLAVPDPELHKQSDKIKKRGKELFELMVERKTM